MAKPLIHVIHKSFQIGIFTSITRNIIFNLRSPAILRKFTITDPFQELTNL